MQLSKKITKLYKYGPNKMIFYNIKTFKLLQESLKQKTSAKIYERIENVLPLNDSTL